MTALLGPHRKPVGDTQAWVTPHGVVEALGGPQTFDLDPCCPAEGMPWATARVMWREGIFDGLADPWPEDAFIWLNPPYDRRLIGLWLAKLSVHRGGGVALVFARTDTSWAQCHVFGAASGVLFLARRLTFHRPDGTPAPAPAGCGSMLVAYRRPAAERLSRVALAGAFVRPGRGKE